MNERGNPESLIPSHPGNMNAVKSGVYSPRLQARRAEEIAAQLAGQPLLEVVRATLMAEVETLRGLEHALLRAVESFGVSTRAGAARSHLDQLSRVSRQLRLVARVTWLEQINDQPRETAAPSPGEAHEQFGVIREDVCRSDLDVDLRLASVRARLSSLLALRDSLDQDLVQHGVVTRRGGDRRQLGQRLRVSRDLVQMLTEVRTDLAAASTAGPHG